MKTVTILMVNNEEDIIRDCLEDRLFYFDIIAIVDSSTDNTPIICQEYMKKYPDRILYKHERRIPFSIKNYRTILYEMIGDKISDDDWIWQLDTDIFPCLGKSRVSIEGIMERANYEGANCIVCDIVQFYPTIEETIAGIDWRKLNYYSTNWRSKIIYKKKGIFFRTDDQETPSVPDEKKASFALYMRHYQYRNPKQIDKKINRAFGVRSYSHIISKDWKDYIVDKKYLKQKISNEGPWSRGGHGWRSLVSLTNDKHKNNSNLYKKLESIQL